MIKIVIYIIHNYPLKILIYITVNFTYTYVYIDIFTIPMTKNLLDDFS